MRAPVDTLFPPPFFLKTKVNPQQPNQYLHALAYPPQWELRRDLADRYAGMGVVASAADLYEALGMWDEVVECYKVLVRCVSGVWVLVLVLILLPCEPIGGDGTLVFCAPHTHKFIQSTEGGTHCPPPPSHKHLNRAALPAPRRWCGSS